MNRSSRREIITKRAMLHCDFKKLLANNFGNDLLRNTNLQGGHGDDSNGLDCLAATSYL